MRLLVQQIASLSIVVGSVLVVAPLSVASAEDLPSGAQPGGRRQLGFGDHLPQVTLGSRSDLNELELYGERKVSERDGNLLRCDVPPPGYRRDVQEGNSRQYDAEFVYRHGFIYPRYPYAVGYYPGFPSGLYPWGGQPRTLKYKSRYYEPGRSGYIPQLHLRTYDPYGWELGIRTPLDMDPLRDERMPPFEGVVAAEKRLLHQAQAKAAMGGGALGLMKDGKYREAGLALADGLQREGSPRYPLLLAEVFFALGKSAHAELLLEIALNSRGIERFLPREIESHFSSRGEFDKHLAELMKSDEQTILHAYFLLHSRDPQRGLDLLQRLIREDSRCEPASLLYRHYITRAFQVSESSRPD